MIPVLSLIGGVRGGDDKQEWESGKEGMCEEIVPERRKARAKALRREGPVHRGNGEQCKMAGAEEDKEGGLSRVMHYLVHCGESHGNLYKIPLSLRSASNLQFTISSICKT